MDFGSGDHKVTDVTLEVTDEGESRARDPLLSIHVSRLVYAMRYQHGMRHDDPLTYHMYCTRRLRRLRIALKHHHGRGRYVSRPIPERFSDSRYLLLPLVAAERSWAAYLEIVQAIDRPRDDQGIVELRNGKKQLAKVIYWKKRRIARAVKNASDLVTLCGKRADKRTQIEAEAYGSLFRGLYCTQTERWGQAIPSLERARLLYVLLWSVAQDDSEHAAAIKKQLTEVHLLLRSAYYYSRGEIGTIHGVVATTEAAGVLERPNVCLVHFRGVPLSISLEASESSGLAALQKALKEVSSSSSGSRSRHTESHGTQASEKIVEKHKVMYERCQRVVQAARDSLINAPDESVAAYLAIEAVARDHRECIALELLLRTLQMRCFPKAKKLVARGLGPFLCDVAEALIQRVPDAIADITPLLQLSVIAREDYREIAKVIGVVETRTRCWTEAIRCLRAVLLAADYLTRGNASSSYTLLEEAKGFTSCQAELATYGSAWQESPFLGVENLCISLQKDALSLVEALSIDAATRLVEEEMGLLVDRPDQDDLRETRREILEAGGATKYEPINCSPILFDLAEYYLPLPHNVEEAAVGSAGVQKKSCADEDSPGIVVKLASWWSRKGSS